MISRLRGSPLASAPLSSGILWAFLSSLTLFAGFWFELTIRHGSSPLAPLDTHVLTHWLWASFPSFSLTLLVLSLWQSLHPATATRAIVPVSLVLIGLEALQTLLPDARFDGLDLAAIVLAAVLVRTLNSLTRPAPSRAPSTATPVWKTAAGISLVLGITAQMACYEYEETCFDDEDKCDTLVFVTKEEVRAEIVPEYGNNAILRIPGKMYQRDHYLGVVDKHRGLHIFDTADPQNPLRVVYLPIHGITDLTIKGDFLYANSYMDMVSINLNDVHQSTFSSTSVTRELDVFTWQAPERFFQGSYLSSEGNHQKRLTNEDTDKIYIGYQSHKGERFLYGRQDSDVLTETKP
ncbi:MAG: hypothetical protein K6L60_11510 [Oceanobacter sp.]